MIGFNGDPLTRIISTTLKFTQVNWTNINNILFDVGPIDTRQEWSYKVNILPPIAGNSAQSHVYG